VPTPIDSVLASVPTQLFIDGQWQPGSDQATLVRFTELDDAISAANNTDYGLVSYVYTTDRAVGIRVAEALESGMVGLNRGIVSDPSAPFGGVKLSGLGREGGHEGMLEYTETKYIATSW
jgi:succinate-semialdehyde dehydrogenase / glutarate-semialdehyde dehydrogenase